MTDNPTLSPQRQPEDQDAALGTDRLTTSTAFPGPLAALFALVVSPVGGWIALFVITVLIDLTSGYSHVDADHLRWRFLESGIRTFPLAVLILVLGLPLVLIGLSVGGFGGRRARLRLWSCLLAGALCGLLFSMLMGIAYYDPDDFIGERDPGRLGYWLQDWWFAAAMAVPGIVSGGTFWFVSRMFARGEGDG